MAEIFNFYVQDNRSIQFPKNNLLEPIMQEDHNVAVWRFRIPKVLNDIDMSAWSWWFVYVNAAGQEFSELLTLVDDIDEPDSFCTADYDIDYGISYNPGNFQFSLEAINANTGGTVLNEWHTKTYSHKVDRTLQGNHAQWAESESDIISALIVEVQNKVSQLVGGATPEPKNLIADMTDTKKVYLYVGSEDGESTNYWYYYNGTQFVPGGLYGAGVQIDSTLSQSGQAADAAAVGDALTSLEDSFSNLEDSFTTAVPSKNLYDKDTCNPQDGKSYNNTYGTIIEASNTAITGLMPADENTQYIFSTGGNAKVKRVFYFTGDSGGTFLSTEVLDNAAFTTPQGCTFIAFTLFVATHTTEQYNAAIAAAQLERGDTATEYEPYGTVSYSFSLPATTNDEGKALSVKTVVNNRVTEWEYKEKGTSVEIDDTLTEDGQAANSKTVGDIVNALAPVVLSKNLYNKDVCNPQNEKTYNASTGAVEDGSSYAVSGKFPVDAETQYIFSTQSLAKVKRVFYFKGDDGGTYISSEVIDNAAFTTPVLCTFAAVNLFAATHTSEQFTAAINASQLEKGSVATGYVPYAETRKIPTDNLIDKVAVQGAANYTTEKSLVNWYDKTLVQDEKYFNSTYNDIYSNSSYAWSGLIPVLPNTHYNISCDKTLEVGALATYYEEWNASKAFIQRTQQKDAMTYISQIHTGANTHYISLNLTFGAAHTTEQLNALLDTIMLVEGTQRPAEYTAYNVEPCVNHRKLDNAYLLNADAFRGKKWLVCGTSVSYQDSHILTGGLHEGEVCRGYIGNVSRRKPMIITNEGVSGSTLAGSDTNSLINRYQNLGFANYDFITIEYGINDFGNNVIVGSASDAAGTDSFAACLKTIIEYVLTQNPTVGLIICTEPDVRGTTTNNNGNTLKDYTNVTLEIAKQYRLPVCDWYYHCGINVLTKGSTSVDYLTADGTHPNNAGHMRMGAMLNQVFDSLLC